MKDTDEETLANLVCGAVGEGVGVKFMATMKNSGKTSNQQMFLTVRLRNLIRVLKFVGNSATVVSYELREVMRKMVQRH